MLGPECVVWLTMDALAACFQIEVAECNMHKTTFILNTGTHNGRFYFRKTVMGNRLSSEVVEGLPGVFKLLIGGQDYGQLADRAKALLERCRQAGMTLASNNVQEGSKVSFAGYIIEGSTQYTDPKKVEASQNTPNQPAYRSCAVGSGSAISSTTMSQAWQGSSRHSETY